MRKLAGRPPRRRGGSRPAGGDVAARFGLAPEPGLVSLASATRRSASPDALWAHTQELPGRLAVVVGPASAKQARAALAMLVPAVTIRWGELSAGVVVDQGARPGPPCLTSSTRRIWQSVVRPGPSRATAIPREKPVNAVAAAAALAPVVWTEIDAASR